MVVVVLYTAAVVDCFPRAQRTSRAMLGVGPAFQLLTDVRRCRFDTLGKFTPAHRAGGAPSVLTWAGLRLAEAAFCPGENSSFTEEWIQVHCQRRAWFDACGHHNMRGSLFPRGAGAHP